MFHKINSSENLHCVFHWEIYLNLPLREILMIPFKFYETKVRKSLW